MVCTRCVLVLKGWWSQVVSGVVTLGCLSPRPARAPPWVRARASSTRPCALHLGGWVGCAAWCAAWCRRGVAVLGCGWVVAGLWRHPSFVYSAAVVLHPFFLSFFFSRWVVRWWWRWCSVLYSYLYSSLSASFRLSFVSLTY